MSRAGFALLREQPQPAADRFLLVFGKSGLSTSRPIADPRQ
jgi:hypothetical protein